MAASDAKLIPLKNAAYRAYFPIYDADGDLVTGASTPDSEVSIDGGAFADCTNEATEIGSTGLYYLDLTAGEMNGDGIVVQVKTATAGAKTTVLIFYPYEDGDIRTDVRMFGGTAGTFSGGRPEVNTTHVSGTAQTANDNGADINAILADTNELQTDWANGGRLDLILDARASQTSVDDLPTNAELTTALASADDAVLAAIAALNNFDPASDTVKANLTQINGTTLTGDGSTTPWGPA